MEFIPLRELRQGDPLAPFLIIIVAEGLVGLVRQAFKRNLLKGVKVGRFEIESCILQFVVDTLFLCEDSNRNVFIIKVILRCYELASGMKINFHKSKLAVINIERNTYDCYARTLNCTQISIPFKYLGMMVGGNPRKVLFWEPIVNKLRTR